MNKLISANFARLFKSGVFKLYMIFSGGVSACMIFMRYADPPVEHSTIDDIAFVGLFYLLFAVPVFIGNFIGTEYSDGTIRNKLIVGHKRSDIYLANLIVCTAGALMGVVLNLLIIFTVGQAVCGMEVLTVPKILELTLYSFATFISATAIIVLISMLVNNKAGGSVAVVLLMFIMLSESISLYSRLVVPEYYENSNAKNPDYLTGTKRTVYQTAYDIMPTSQMQEYIIQETDRTNKFVVYDGIILVATTALGIILFRKKDLK